MPADTLGTFITYNPLVVSLEHRVDDLLQMLQLHGFHHWPVVDEEHRLIGLVSSTDVVRSFHMQTAAETSTFGGPRGDAAPLTVGEVMSSHLITVEETATPRQVLAVLLENGIHSVPVLRGERLIGLITTSDFIRELSYGQHWLAAEAASEYAVLDVDPIEISASLEEAVLTMRIAGMKHLGVVREGKPIGVVSERAVHEAQCRCEMEDILGREIDLRGAHTVADIVKQAPTLRPGQTIGKAAGVMSDLGVQAIAVVNQAQRFIGLLTEDTLLRAWLPHLK